MIRCPGCSYLVPPTWGACRRCGTTIGAPVTATVGAAVAASANGTAPNPRPGTVPAPPPPGAFDLLPTPTGSSAARPRPSLQAPAPRRAVGAAAARRARGLLIALGVAVLLVAGWMAWPRSDGDGGASANGMTVLDPIGEGPAGVQDAFRVQAEANLRVATSAMQVLYAQSGDVSTITPATLTQFDPTLQYVDGNTASTTSAMVSVASTGNEVTVAVAAQGGICAFARLDATGSLDTVTVTTSNPCRASGAPAEGWSTLSGSGGGGVLAPGGGAINLPQSASFEPGLSAN